MGKVFHHVPEQNGERPIRPLFPINMASVVNDYLVIFLVQVVSLNVRGMDFDRDPPSVEAQMASQDRVSTFSWPDINNGGSSGLGNAVIDPPSTLNSTRCHYGVGTIAMR